MWQICQQSQSSFIIDFSLSWIILKGNIGILNSLHQLFRSTAWKWTGILGCISWQHNLTPEHRHASGDYLPKPIFKCGWLFMRGVLWFNIQFKEEKPRQLAFQHDKRPIERFVLEKGNCFAYKIPFTCQHTRNRDPVCL